MSQPNQHLVTQNPRMFKGLQTSDNLVAQGESLPSPAPYVSREPTATIQTALDYRMPPYSRVLADLAPPNGHSLETALHAVRQAQSQMQASVDQTHRLNLASDIPSNMYTHQAKHSYHLQTNYSPLKSTNERVVNSRKDEQTSKPANTTKNRQDYQVKCFESPQEEDARLQPLVRHPEISILLSYYFLVLHV